MADAEIRPTSGTDATEDRERGDHAGDEHHVVILGAGFAGMTTARRLARTAERDRLRITIVDRHNYHTFHPLLYQVATAGLEPHSVGRSIRGAFRRSPVRFCLGAVVEVDWDRRRVVLDTEQELAFDTLVVAVGSSSADYGIEGVAEHTFPLKSLPEASRLRNHVLRQFEAANTAAAQPDEATLTVVVAGGGPTGVELAGALAELVDRVVQNDRPDLDLSRRRIVLVEMLDSLLPPYREAQREHTRKALEARGVEVRLGTAIERVEADRVLLSDGDELATRTVVWTAGVRAHPLGDQLGVEQTKGGRVVVAPDLRIPDRHGAFVAGDLAGATDRDGELLPQLAAVAIQQGRHVADQIVRRRRGLATQRFRYRDKGTMATIGRRDAVAELPLGVQLRGLPARVAWLALHLFQLIGFRNRASVLLDWTYNYLTYDKAARLILEQQEPDEAEQLSQRPG
jgi:NADH:ubiquinone reductase (H+-translocating)